MYDYSEISPRYRTLKSIWFCENSFSFETVYSLSQEIYIIIIPTDANNYLILSTHYVLRAILNAFWMLDIYNTSTGQSNMVAACSFLSLNLNYLKLNKMKISVSWVTFHVLNISEQNRFRTLYQHRKFYLLNRNTK